MGGDLERFYMGGTAAQSPQQYNLEARRMVVVVVVVVAGGRQSGKRAERRTGHTEAWPLAMWPLEVCPLKG
jgi:hypothetical protein